MLFRSTGSGGALSDTDTVAITVVQTTPADPNDNDSLVPPTNTNTSGTEVSTNVWEGTTGSDTITTGGGSQSIYGGAGNDIIASGAGGDSVYGGSGNDTINGGSSGDALYGGSGNDSIIGDQGADTIVGGQGADNLRGDSVSNPNSGNDKFVFTNLTDSLVNAFDTITDFDPGHDTIQVPHAVTSGDFNNSFYLTPVVASHGSLSAELVAILNSGNLNEYGAAEVTITGSAYQGTYVVVNDTTPGFDPLHDAVIKLSNAAAVAHTDFVV